MHRIGILSAAVATAAAAIMVVAPVTASAAPAATAFATCPLFVDGVVAAIQGADVYSGADSFRVVGKVVKGERVPCLQGIEIGRRYSACGESDGNGWIRLLFNGGIEEWSPQACFIDAN